MKYRLPTTQLSLPNDENSLRVPVNKVSDNTTFNEKIQLLSENFDYLLNIAEVVNNVSPKEYDRVYSFSDQAWTETPSSYVSSPPDDHGYNHIEVVEMATGQFLYILAKDTQIDFYIGGDISQEITPSSLTLKISYKQIRQNGNQLFKNIEYLKYDSDRLYVYDSGYRGIVVYDIASLIYGDVVVENIKFVRQFTQLKNVVAIDISTSVYVITNTKLLLLNRDLNILKNVELTKSSPIDILVDDEIYISYSDEIHQYNIGLEFINSTEFSSFENESILTIMDSKIDDGVVYILTSKYVYKYDIQENLIIGYFKLGITRDKNYIDIFVKEDFETDHIFLLDENKLHFIEDNIIKEYMYDRVNLDDRVDISNLRLEDMELEQDFVYNTALQKIIFNNLLLYNSLIFKPSSLTDDTGFLEYSHKKNLVNSEVIQINPIFMGQNEVFSYQIFLRALTNILDIQNKILNLLEYEVTENSTNTLLI